MVEELGGKIVTLNSANKSNAAKKQKILKDLEESVAFVQQHEQGKVKAKTIEQLLDEL